MASSPPTLFDDNVSPNTPDLPITLLEARRWVEKEAEVIYHIKPPDEFSEDDDDIYNIFLAFKLLCDSNNSSSQINEPNNSEIGLSDDDRACYNVTDSLTESMGSIFAPSLSIASNMYLKSSIQKSGRYS